MRGKILTADENGQPSDSSADQTKAMKDVMKMVSNMFQTITSTANKISESEEEKFVAVEKGYIFIAMPMAETSELKDVWDAIRRTSRRGCP
jgi:transcription antitermination factor NusG